MTIAVRGENPTIANRVKSWRMHRGCEARDQGQRIHFDRDGTVAERFLELDGDQTISGQGDVLLRDGGPQHGAGRARYNQAQVDACLIAIRQARCSTLTAINRLSALPECDSTFAVPLVAVGGTCQNDFECIDTVCVKTAGAGQGICAAGVSAGTSCVADRCGQDLLCDPRDGSNANDDVCVAEQENGAACADNFECKSRVCAAPAAGGAKLCAAPSTAVCFYGGGCSLGHGRAGLTSLLVLAAFALVTVRRARHPRRAA